VTPVPLILFLWGIALASGLLPNNILGWRVPATAAWRRRRLTIAIAAIVSGGLWLVLDLTLPLILPRAHMGSRLADIAGWALVIAAVATCIRLIASRRPTHTFRPN
jgi:formate-dependent nitrite reductase membrane component NrfD